MKIIFIFIFMILMSCVNNNLKPPLIDKVNVADEYHGQKVVDPYRNLENLKDSTVINWLKAQEKYASRILNQISGQEKLIKKQREFDAEKPYNIYSTKRTYNERIFYTKLITGDSITKLYYKDGYNGLEKLILNPYNYNNYIINYFKPNWKGDKVAISLAKEGEEISEIIVVDVLSKTIISKTIKNARPNIGGIQWLPDDSGFIYIYHPNIDPHNSNYSLDSKSVLHKLGNDSKLQIEIFSKSNNPEVNFKSEDFPKVFIYENYYSYAFGEVGGSSKFKDMYFKPIDKLTLSNEPWQLLYKKSDKVQQIHIHENDFIFLTAKNASNYEICKTSIKNPNFKNAQILIPKRDNSVITDFTVSKDGIFFVRVINGVEAKLYCYKDGKETEIVMPKPSGNIEISSNGYKKKNITVYTEGWLEEQTPYEYDYTNNRFKNISLHPIFEYPEFKNLVVKEIEIRSHDGKMIPLSIIHNENIKLNGENSTLFTGYGSYGVIGSPFFSSNFLTWVSEGGILAIAHVRGGGEKGDAWHKGGFKSTKPNTWKDMIACTEYMIEEGYTRPEKSVLMGSSAGGIMAGRAMTDRPDLYKAVILISPAMNMLRSEIQPNGLNSIKEFGTVEKEEEFKALLEMDSYHNIKKGVEYPATIVTTGIKDGRVVVWDPAKFVAKLQENTNSFNNPILLSVDFDSFACFSSL